MNESQAARANRDGDPCPSWCATDHGKELIPSHFIDTHNGEHVYAAYANVCPVLFPPASEPAVQVCTGGADGGSLFLDASRAGYLARLVEDLATATPEQHRELAAAIRQAAAVITGTEAQR